MNWIFLFIFIFSFGCSSGPSRKVASFTESVVRKGRIDHKRSIVKLFPPEVEHDVHRYYFYVQLKNKQGQFVDCEEKDLALKGAKGEKLPFKVERVLVGRYYLILELKKAINAAQLEFSVKGRTLPEQFKLHTAIPVKEKSKLIIVSKKKRSLHLRLFLNDQKGRPVELGSVPEIILDGDAIISDPVMKKEGVWDFKISFSEHNQIFYFSVRAQGAYFERILRYQHIEK